LNGKETPKQEPAKEPEDIKKRQNIKDEEANA